MDSDTQTDRQTDEEIKRQVHLLFFHVSSLMISKLKFGVRVAFVLGEGK